MFRPSVRVTDPNGRAWEIYATRLPLRNHAAPVRPEPAYRRLFRRLVVTVPRAAIRALRADTWTIEAIAWMPFKTTYTWQTSTEYRGHVLAQVEGQLARGEKPRPGHARFLGVS